MITIFKDLETTLKENAKRNVLIKLKPITPINENTAPTEALNTLYEIIHRETTLQKYAKENNLKIVRVNI